jgi:carbonic anhydrase
VTKDLLSNNERFARDFSRGDAPQPPARHLAVVTCMDARLDVMQILGLQIGDAHIIRNAGGVITDDTLRSLLISQRLLGTTKIVLIHHTDCGMLKFDGEELKDEIEAETGERPPFSLQDFSDLAGSVRRSIALLRDTPFVPHTEHMRGFIYDVRTGRLTEVETDGGVDLGGDEVEASGVAVTQPQPVPARASERL